ncbi:hypothetical protein GBAR_LOCUS15554, partial [Geodia barretti]
AGIVASFIDIPLRNLEDAALNLVGLGGGEKKEGRTNGDNDGQRTAEEGGVGHENIYFSELERAEEKRMRLEEDGAEDQEDANMDELKGYFSLFITTANMDELKGYFSLFI